jgi:nitrate/nitrite transporter NarK
VLGGLAVATLALFWIALAATWDSYALLAPGLLIWGGGMSFCYAPALRAMANSVPQEKQGQTSGIGVTSRLLGGTIGVAVCSTLFVMTGSFQVVLLAAGGVMLAALVVAWFAIERQDTTQAP